MASSLLEVHPIIIDNLSITDCRDYLPESFVILHRYNFFKCNQKFRQLVFLQLEIVKWWFVNTAALTHYRTKDIFDLSKDYFEEFPSNWVLLHSVWFFWFDIIIVHRCSLLLPSLNDLMQILQIIFYQLHFPSKYKIINQLTVASFGFYFSSYWWSHFI